LQILRATLRLCAALACAFTLASCGADANFADDAAVARASFVSGEPPSVTLYTVVNNRSNEGAHSSLLLDGRERVIYDPAGTWHHPTAPERFDMHYGMTDQMVSFYIDYHARETFRVIEQEIYVSQATMDLIMARAIAKGAAGKATCANTLSAILRDVPGFESIGSTWFPNRLAEDFGALAGVTERTIRDGDPDENSGVLTVQANGEPGGI
jgi:hypothetical protein